MTLTPAKAERIARLLLDGASLDLLSEDGVLLGWTREDVKAVVAQKGWTLNWEGKLRSRTPASATSDDGEVDYDRMLAVGVDHERIEVRRLAVKAQQALDALQRELVLQEEKNAEEVARQRRIQRLQRDPSSWAHGTWGGYLCHAKHGVPLCPACEEAGNAYREEASVSGRTVPYRNRPAIATDRLTA